MPPSLDTTNEVHSQFVFDIKTEYSVVSLKTCYLEFFADVRNHNGAGLYAAAKEKSLVKSGPIDSFSVYEPTTSSV